MNFQEWKSQQTLLKLLQITCLRLMHSKRGNNYWHGCAFLMCPISKTEKIIFTHFYKKIYPFCYIATQQRPDKPTTHTHTHIYSNTSDYGIVLHVHNSKTFSYFGDYVHLNVREKKDTVMHSLTMETV